MKYSNLEWTIGELINLIESQKINLRPPYQRNFIWSSKDQKLLIDSIRKGYPLPNFFILKNKDNTFEMVDGQQRAITIYKFIKNEFRDSSKHYYKDYNENTFMNCKHSKKCTFYTLRFGCSFAAVNTIKPQLL